MSRRFLIATMAVAIAFGAGIGLWQTQTTEAQGGPEFSLPAQAVEVAPGIFSLGTAVVNGRTVEGIAIAHHRDGHTKGGGGEDPTPEPTATPTPDPIDLAVAATCFSFINAGTSWATAEPWLFTPFGPATLAHMDASLQAWDVEVGANIFGTGTATSGLSADGNAPDGANEAYFARIVGPGARGTIAFTIIWWELNGPFIEWDMVFNTRFSWATDGSSNAMDFLNIATHETGHAAGMGHTEAINDCSEQTMFPTGSNGETQKRTLDVGDIAGIKSLY
ncbi:MAG: matrixin family metalloprotease [Dehalococcoidia bacterium]